MVPYDNNKFKVKSNIARITDFKQSPFKQHTQTNRNIASNTSLLILTFNCCSISLFIIDWIRLKWIWKAF